MDSEKGHVTKWDNAPAPTCVLNKLWFANSNIMIDFAFFLISWAFMPVTNAYADI